MKKWAGIGIVLIAAVAIFYFFSSRDKVQERLTKAHKSYLVGEKANTIAAREKAFNRALTLYLEMKKSHPLEFSNGKLYYNIGNTYFQLEQYPRAVLYYYRALKLRPSDEKVINNLSVARRELGFQKQDRTKPFERALFFHFFYSLPERLQIFSFFSFLAIIFGSLTLLFRNLWLRRVAFLFLGIAIIMLLSVGYTYYLEPVGAVVIESSYLYRDAGTQYAKVGDEPMKAGTKIHILDVEEDGKWIKAYGPDGTLGYLPYKTVRKI